MKYNSSKAVSETELMNVCGGRRIPDEVRNKHIEIIKELERKLYNRHW